LSLLVRESAPKSSKDFQLSTCHPTMALRQAVSSITRPLKATVKPSTIVAEHTMRSTPEPIKALIEAPKEFKLPESATVDSHGHVYSWGITWTGETKYLRGAPMVDWKEIGVAFETWHIFTIGTPSFWADMLASSTAVFASSLPLKK